MNDHQKIRNVLFTLSLLFNVVMINKVHAADFQFGEEKLRGMAGVANPESMSSIFYNPASRTSASGFNISYVDNSRFEKISELMESMEGLSAKKDRKRVLETFEATIGKRAFISPNIAFLSTLPRGVTFGGAMSTQANAAILGLVSPSLELSIESKVVGVIPYSLLNLFDSQLSVGVSLKPTYKLEYKLQETILEIFENSKLLGIYNRAQEGVGLGLDFGFILHKVYEADELKVGGRITNLGDTAYKSRQIITKQKNQEPSKDKAGLNLGSSYLLNLTQDESIELAFAVMVNNVLTPQQSNALSLGSTLNFFNKKFKIYLGHNHDDRSIGFKVCFKKVNLIYGYINEHGGNLTSKERHLIQIQYFVS